MADLFIVGQYNGAASLSGVSIGSQVMHMITVMLVGIAMGSTVMIGRYVGERKEEEKRMIVGNTSIIFMILSLIVTLIPSQVLSYQSVGFCSDQPGFGKLIG